MDTSQLSSVLVGIRKHLHGIGANGYSAQSSRMAPCVWTHLELRVHLLCERRKLGNKIGRVSILSQSKRKESSEL